MLRTVLDPFKRAIKVSQQKQDPSKKAARFYTSTVLLEKKVDISCEVLVLRPPLCPTDSKHINAADGFEAK